MAFPSVKGDIPLNHSTSEVQGERRVELVRTLLSRSLHSPLHLKCNGKVTTSAHPFCCQKLPPIASGQLFPKYFAESRIMLTFADENIKSFTMEEQKTTYLTTEELSKAQRTIAVVLAEIQEEGHSKIMPFDIGEVEIRMLRYAAINGITLGSDRLYMSAKQLTHTIRQSKRGKGLAVDLIEPH